MIQSQYLPNLHLLSLWNRFMSSLFGKNGGGTQLSLPNPVLYCMPGNVILGLLRTIRAYERNKVLVLVVMYIKSSSY